jgi:adenylate cyclase
LRPKRTSPSEPQESVRLLAAIMFTDIVGYTAMMQKNERKAKKLRDRHRKVLEAQIAAYQGKILQHFGDGTLSVFVSAIHAVSCAVRAQQELQKEPRIPIRIGVHLGDIAYNEEGVYGDSVNIASRIEALALPGSVIISDKVYDEIKNQPGLPVRPLGTRYLKNVREPVDLYALANDGLMVPKPDDISGLTKDEGISIAVLPLVNISPDPENEYFADGITEEIINTLSKVDGMTVKSRTSSFAFKGKNLDVRDIGGRLGVTYIIEGSVRKEGGNVRITVQLVDASDGSQLWAEEYDRKLEEEVLKLQDEISGKIVEKLKEIPLK